MVLIMKKLFNMKNLMRFILFTFIASIVFISVRIILAPTIVPADATFAGADTRVKGDYVLMLLQSIFGVIAMLLPRFLRRRAKINIPSVMMIAYAVFLYSAIYLGEVRAFYYQVRHWDTILHTFSGAALGALGFSIVSLLNKSESITFELSPVFVAMFAFCFAVTLGVIWEIYEYTMDYFIHTNMQKYAFETGELLIGQEALIDTMKDLVVDALGAFAVSVIGFISLKYDKKWLDRFHIRRVS